VRNPPDGRRGEWSEGIPQSVVEWINPSNTVIGLRPSVGWRMGVLVIEATFQADGTNAGPGLAGLC
jgi:hypothetical protein